MFLSVVVDDEQQAHEVAELCYRRASVRSSEMGRINVGPLVVLMQIAGLNTEGDIDSVLADALAELGVSCVWTSHRPDGFVPTA